MKSGYLRILAQTTLGTHFLTGRRREATHSSTKENPSVHVAYKYIYLCLLPLT